MKKGLVFAMMAAMTVGLVGCGGNTTDTVSETTVEESSVSEVATEANDDVTEAEPEVEETVDAALPAVKGVSHDFSYELVGMDMTKASYSAEDVLRLWFMVTNNNDRAETPDDISSWDGLVAFQGDEELGGYMTEDNPLEEQVIIQQILPGTTVLCAETFKLVDDQVISITMTDDANTFDFEVDPVNFTEILPEPFTWATVEDTSFFEPEGETYDNSNVVYTINTIELQDGTDWMGRTECKVLRIVLDVTNNADSERVVTNPFTPFQDGVELKLGNPTEEDENVDIQINTKMAAGETRQIAQTYVLYNETSPVIVMKDDFGSVFGTVYNVK